MSFLKPSKAFKQSWMLSDDGKKLSAYTANAVVSGVVLAQTLPHTICVSYYKDFVRLYSKGTMVPVPDKLTERFNKVLDMLKIQENRQLYEPFMSCGFDMFSIGTHGRFGMHIGIPVNFTYEDTSSIDRSRILVNQESVAWDSDAGKQLLNALVVPEKGQMFAIAREIKFCESYKFFFDTFFGTAGCVFTIIGSVLLNNKLKLYSKPRSVRLFGYSLMGLINLANYCMCKDLTQNIYDEKIDRELKEMSPELAEGGKQFYSKILERNKALRVLMEKEGESMFTVTGNENFWIRNKHRPLVQRLAFFEEATPPLQMNGPSQKQSNLIS